MKKYEYEIQGNYIGTWDRLTTEETEQEAQEMLKCYDENEPRTPHRIIKKEVTK